MRHALAGALLLLAMLLGISTGAAGDGCGRTADAATVAEGGAHRATAEAQHRHDAVPDPVAAQPPPSCGAGDVTLAAVADAAVAATPVAPPSPRRVGVASAGDPSRPFRPPRPI